MFARSSALVAPTPARRKARVRRERGIRYRFDMVSSQYLITDRGVRHVGEWMIMFDQP
jgi:hypothetical protein